MAFKNSELNTSGDYFKKGSFVLIISVILGFVADYGFNLTLSQSLTSHEYGDYKVAYAFATISSVLILLGGDRVAPRLLSTGLANKDNTGVWEFYGFI
jgi:O-antigen/teichoic acid export membrane protein